MVRDRLDFRDLRSCDCICDPVSPVKIRRLGVMTHVPAIKPVPGGVFRV